MDKETFESAVNKKLTIRELSSLFKVSNFQIRAWMKLYRLSTFRKQNKSYTISDDLLKITVFECKTIKEVFNVLGLAASGSSYSVLKRRIHALNLDLSHFDTHSDRAKATLKKLQAKKRIADSEVLIEHSTVSQNVVKRCAKRLLAYNCNICLLTSTWNSAELVLQLDHINGIRTDNRLENLRWLCPNCHSQTNTFGSRNKIKNKLKY